MYYFFIINKLSLRTHEFAWRAGKNGFLGRIRPEYRNLETPAVLYYVSTSVAKLKLRQESCQLNKATLHLVI